MRGKKTGSILVTSSSSNNHLIQPLHCPKLSAPSTSQALVEVQSTAEYTKSLSPRAAAPKYKVVAAQKDCQACLDPEVDSNMDKMHVTSSAWEWAFTPTNYLCTHWGWVLASLFSLELTHPNWKIAKGSKQGGKEGDAKICKERAYIIVENYHWDHRIYGIIGSYKVI